MERRRRRPLVFLLALAAALVVNVAAAQPLGRSGETRVRIVVPAAPSPSLEEAIVRIRAELATFGFVVRVEIGTGSEADTGPGDAAPHADGDVGSIVLDEESGRVRIEAMALGLEAPLTQAADTNRTSAEVIAVRAVESLRAAMIQAARERPGHVTSAASDTTVVPEPIVRFTHLEEQEDEPNGSPSVTDVPSEVEGERASSTDTEPLRVILELGALARLGTSRASFGMGAEMHASLQKGWFRVGLLLDGTPAPSVVERPEGSITVRHFGVALRLGGTFALSERFDLQWGLGAGIEADWFSARAAPGYAATSADLVQGVLLADGGATYWIVDELGLLCRLRGGLLLDAPVLKIGGVDVARLGRPHVGASCGMALRF